MSFHCTRQHKARKEHYCCECGGIIIPGENYVLYVGVYESDFYSEKMCCDCSPVYDEVNRHSWRVNGEGVTFGTMYECIEYNAEKFPKYLLTRFKRGSRIQPWMIKRYHELQGTTAQLSEPNTSK